jgi:hypothetical protein
MAMNTKAPKSVLVNCRLTPALEVKLKRLTALAGRSRSDVLRWLIARATVADLPAGWVQVAAEQRKLLAEVEA